MKDFLETGIVQNQKEKEEIILLFIYDLYKKRENPVLAFYMSSITINALFIFICTGLIYAHIYLEDVLLNNMKSSMSWLVF